MGSDSESSSQTGSRRQFLRKSALAGGGLLLGAAGLNEAAPQVWPQTPVFETNHSYWAQAASPPTPALAQDIEVDVAILGGGLTGLSSAYFICRNRPGARVAVFEARGCGNGASGRNGAMVLTMTADRFMNFSSDPELDKRIYDLTAANLQAIEELSASTGIDCELDRNGSLQVFNANSDLEAGRTYVTRARALEMPVELWEKEQVRAAVGTDLYPGGFFDPAGGHVQPMKLVQAFKTAAQKAGAVIYENTAIAHIAEGATHTLHTADGKQVRARAVVLATNAFSSRLGFFRHAILPVHEYVGMTAPLSDAQIAAIGWRKRIPFNDSRTEVFYLGLTRDQRIHIGGGHASYRFNDNVSDPQDGPAHFAALARELKRIFPSLAPGFGSNPTSAFQRTWAGVVDWSLDASPSVGRTGKHGNIFYGIGYSGHGVNLSSVFGRIIADLESGWDEAWRIFPFVNRTLPYIPNEPFRSLGARVAMAWYEMAG
jgi:gamma-glutamylputrescine oxidase